jgi:hypothetical protein
MLARDRDAARMAAGSLPRLEQELSTLRQAAARSRTEAERLRQENQRLKQPRPGTALATAAPLPLQDSAGDLALDLGGNLVRMEKLPESVSNAVRARRLPKPVQMAKLIGVGDIVRGGDTPAFSVVAPAGTAVLTDRPTFRWSAFRGADAYTVAVYDPDLNPVAESGRVMGTTWQPRRPLRRAILYRWEVTALKGTEELAKAPSPPAPDARFQVVSQQKARELEGARRAHRGSHLVLGVLYAEAGLLDDAERELAALQQANSGSDLARDLLVQVRALRKPAPAEPSALPGNP